jgi:hypothetical protein
MIGSQMYLKVKKIAHIIFKKFREFCFKSVTRLCYWVSLKQLSLTKEYIEVP